MELELTLTETLLADIHVSVRSCKEGLEIILLGIPLGKDWIRNTEDN